MQDDQTYTLTHSQQISLGNTKSLISAGIGKVYHTGRVSDVPNTSVLVAWIRDNLRQKTLSGNGVTIVGNGVNALDATILTASVIHTMGQTSLVVPLSRLVVWAQHETEDYWRATECAALFITNFYQVYGGAKEPLTPWQVQMIETFLTDRINNGKAVYLHMASMTGPVWWSQTFLQLVAKFNILIEVA